MNINNIVIFVIMGASLIVGLKREIVFNSVGELVFEFPLGYVLRSDYVLRTPLTQTLGIIRNPVFHRLIAFQRHRRRFRGCLCAKNRSSLQTG